MVIAVGSYPTRLRPFAGSSPATDTNAGMAKLVARAELKPLSQKTFTGSTPVSCTNLEP